MFTLKLDFSEFVDPRRVGVLWLLAGFVVTALLTRWITRYIRSRSHRSVDPHEASSKQRKRNLIKNIHIGGVHVHHQVWGILLVMLVGLLIIAYQPGGVAADVLAGLFGAGAALALDEFAMWLHLEDVYWSREGRKSISALMTAAAIAVVLMIGAAPLGLEADQEGETGAGVLLLVTVLINLAFAVICILKGKLPLALLGVFLPLVALFGAVRLAKPDSWWARRRYRPDGRSLRRSQTRFGPRYARRWDRIHGFIGGSITEPAADEPASRP
jgi:hypothetical protein